MSRCPGGDGAGNIKYIRKSRWLSVAHLLRHQDTAAETGWHRWSFSDQAAAAVDCVPAAFLCERRVTAVSRMLYLNATGQMLRWEPGGGVRAVQWRTPSTCPHSSRSNSVDTLDRLYLFPPQREELPCGSSSSTGKQSTSCTCEMFDF